MTRSEARSRLRALLARLYDSKAADAAQDARALAALLEREERLTKALQVAGDRAAELADAARTAGAWSVEPRRLG